MNLGLIGFGGVGKSFIQLIYEKNYLLKNLKLKYIIKSNGGIYSKEGINLEEINDYIKNNIPIENHRLWKDISIEDIIKNKDIDYLIELTNTNIENGEPGYTNIKKSLENKINVITGNKGPILLHYHELKKIANKNKVHLKIGCTAGGALPSINVGTNDVLGSEVLEIEGVLNGTTNFILEEMKNNKITYEEALKNAQRLKIAESNPSLDVDGFDTAIKILILAKVVMGIEISLDNVYIKGIRNITLDEILESSSNDRKLKLIGSVVLNDKDISVEVKPKIIDKKHPLYQVDGKSKGVYYKTDILGDITIIGGESSTLNAAAAIFRDLMSIIN